MYSYDHHFIMKESAEEFKNQFKKYWKYIIFTVPMEKEVTRIDKNGEEITPKNLTYYNLLRMQDLWQAHCDCFLI